MKRLVAQLVLEAPPRRDVAVVDDDPADRGLVEQVATDDLDQPLRAVRVQGPNLGRDLAAGRGDELVEELLEARPVVGMDHVETGRPDPLFGPVAEDAFDRGTLVRDEAVRADDHVHVIGVPDEGSEPLLASAQVRDEELLGQRLLAQATVLAGQEAGRRVST